MYRSAKTAELQALSVTDETVSSVLGTANTIFIPAHNYNALNEQLKNLGAGLKYVAADDKIYLVNVKGEIIGDGIPKPKDGVGIVDIELSEVK